MPTPAVAMLTRSLRADLGVMISASHNPFDDNGIKLFDAEGYKLSDDTEKKIARVAQPKLFVAAAQDDVAPPAHARRLFDLARSPKELLVVPGAGHNDAYVVGGEKYLAVWRRFLTLQGCRREGSFGVAAQVDLISEDLRDLKAVWDLLCEISCWSHNSLRFDGVGPV